jgi:hypothetical protein
VGRFTINVVVALDAKNPGMANGVRSGSDFRDGYYRIGFLIGKKDKWWHLKADEDSILTQVWRPSSYDNFDFVLSEAIDDVSGDVLATLHLLGITDGQKDGGS